MLIQIQLRDICGLAMRLDKMEVEVKSEACGAVCWQHNMDRLIEGSKWRDWK